MNEDEEHETEKDINGEEIVEEKEVEQVEKIIDVDVEGELEKEVEVAGEVGEAEVEVKEVIEDEVEVDEEDEVEKTPVVEVEVEAENGKTEKEDKVIMEEDIEKHGTNEKKLEDVNSKYTVAPPLHITTEKVVGFLKICKPYNITDPLFGEFCKYNVKQSKFKNRLFLFQSNLKIQF